MEVLFALGLFAFGAMIYFIPLIVAISEQRPNTSAIGALNLFLGWTFVGWVVALVWAMTKAKS